MNGNFTLFKSDSAAGSGAIDYVKDDFLDTSRTATSNSGFSSTISTNPMSNLYADDDSSRYGVKTLWIKDLVLEQDKSLWISSKRTYRIIWNDSFAPVQGYAFGEVYFNRVNNQKFLTINTVNDGVGIGGVIRKVIWLVAGSTSTGTAQRVIDGVNSGSPISFGNVSFDAGSAVVQTNKYFGFESASALQTQDIHDFRLVSVQAGTLNVVGAIVYFQNAGGNIEQFPGTTYIDKNRSTTTNGATLNIPSLGSSLGGKNSIYKTSGGAYGITSQIIAELSTIGVGSSGTNLVNVTTGQGASFPAGTGLVGQFGSSTFYVGSVQSVSTDTLTVGPTLYTGISGPLYRAWQAGPTLAIDNQIYEPIYEFNQSQMIGYTNSFIDPNGRFAVWGQGSTSIMGDTLIPTLRFPTSGPGLLHVEGYFSAADIDFVGSGILNASVGVNGTPAWALNEGSTSVLKKTIFTGAGPGWNSFDFAIGSSYNTVGINKISFYGVKRNGVPTFGVLSNFDTLQSYVPRNDLNATTMFLGAHRRIFSDALGLQGSWVRATGVSFPGGMGYFGSSSNSTITTYFYGKHFSVIGVAGGSLTMTLDGNAIGATLNVPLGATEGLHNLVTTVKSGTMIIHAVDVMRTYGELCSVQNYVTLSDQISSLNKRMLNSDAQWHKFSVTIDAATPPTKATARVIDHGIWSLVGNMMEVYYNYAHDDNTGSAAGSGEYIYRLVPPGFRIDIESVYLKESPRTVGAPILNSFFTAYSVGNGRLAGNAFINDATSVKLVDTGNTVHSSGAVPMDSNPLLITVALRFPVKIDPYGG